VTGSNPGITQRREQSRQRTWSGWAGAVLGLLVASFALSWVSSRFTSFAGWPWLSGGFFLGAAILAAAWYGLKADRKIYLPAGLAWLLAGAALLRLAAGAFWFVALPAWGYGSPVEQAGYIMADAEARDQTAWELAASGEPLWTAFRDYRLADQYGGLLFLSALVYRYLGGSEHLPLQMVVLTASFSALAVLFTFAFARRAWEARAAWLAAWIVALFPEAVLLGSSQMREAFTVTLAIAAFYGLVRYFQDRSWTGLLFVAGSLGSCMFFSPPFAAVLLIMLSLQALSLNRWRALRQPRFWLLIGVLGVVALAGIWLSWRRFAPDGIENPVALAAWWLKQTARWQATVARKASGWLQRIFKTMPGWTQIPFLLLYGLAQPFLPAAILQSSIPLWRGIAIWRSLGWTAVLILLVFATLRAWGRPGRGSLASGLALVVWVGILLASLRSGGDLWDNPRYRTAFTGLQAALVAWAWLEQLRSPNPWLRRITVGAALILAWFLPWYLRRYTPISWVVVDLFKTIGLGLASAFLYALWDWVRGERSSLPDSDPTYNPYHGRS
jgi:hypothetical protein